MDRQNYKNTYISLFPIELLIELSLFIWHDQLVQLLETLPVFSRLINSNVFWKQRWKRDISSYLPPPENPYEKYLKLNELVGRNDEMIEYLAKNGYDILLKPMLMTKRDYDDALTSAALGNQLPIVKAMINKGATSLNTAFVYATKENNWDVVDFLIKLVPP